MICYVYLDVYFVFNVIMDFLLLWMVCIWEGEGKSRWYCFLAANMGGVYAVLAMMIHISVVLQWILTYFVMGQVLVAISMRWRGIQQHISRMVSLYMGSFFLCGLLVVYGDISGDQRRLYRATGLSGLIDGKFCVGMTIMVCIFLYSFMGRIRHDWQIRKNVEAAELIVGGKNKKIMALCDTGNCLVEPMTGKPVCVVSARIVAGINTEKIILIPYNTIDQNRGMMQGFWAEKLRIGDRVYENVPMAVHDGAWSRKGRYEMILHPKYFEEGGVAYDCRKRKNILDRKVEGV